jgi:hypothetical protein
LTDHLATYLSLPFTKDYAILQVKVVTETFVIASDRAQ